MYTKSDAAFCTVYSFITKTYLYNFDPLKPLLYSKTGVTGVYIIFLISAQKLGEAVLTSTHNLFFEEIYEKHQNFLSENFQEFCGEIFNIFEQECFRNVFRSVCPNT